MKAVFLDYKSVDPGDLDSQCVSHEVATVFYDHSTGDEIIQRSQDCEIVITNKCVLDRKFFDASDKLKLVCVAATGINNIDLDAASANNVIVSNVRDYATSAVAQHVFAGLLNFMTSQDHYRTAAQDGTWSQSPQFCPLSQPISELSGKHMVILGYGVLGQAVAQLAEAFGMYVTVARRPGSDDRTRSCILSLLPLADVLSIHCPLTDKTRNLLGTEELSYLPEEAIVVNTARGGIINEQALAQALIERTLRGAVIDVLDQEPPPANHPLLNTEIPNLILTPHTAWASREARQRLLEQVAENIIAWNDGSPTRVC